VGDPTSHEARIDALTDERDALKAGVNGLVQECDMLRTRITCVEAAYEKRIATLTAERDALKAEGAAWREGAQADIDFTLLTREEAIDRIGKLDDPKLRPLIKWIAESLAFGRVAYDVRVNIAEAERLVEGIVAGPPGPPGRIGDISETGPRGPEKWPPLDPGTKVRTTKPFWSGRDLIGEALASRKWGVKGTILKHHDSHGLCYEVQHEDGTVGHYDPSELEVLDVPRKHISLADVGRSHIAHLCQGVADRHLASEILEEAKRRVWKDTCGSDLTLSNAVAVLEALRQELLR